MFELHERDYHRFNLSRMAEDALEVFNALLHEDKTEFFEPNTPTKTLGYEFKGVLIKQDRKKLFFKAIFTDHYIDNVEQAAGRIFNFYAIGGSNDPIFEQAVMLYLQHTRVSKFRFSRDNIQKFLFKLQGYSIDHGPMDISPIGCSLALTTGTSLTLMLDSFGPL